MFEYLQPADGPVIEGLEDRETVFAADQPQYHPLRTLVGLVKIQGQPAKTVLSRWRLTPEQREAIAKGEVDIYLELTTFGKPLQPIRMAVGNAGQMPEEVLDMFFSPER